MLVPLHGTEFIRPTETPHYGVEGKSSAIKMTRRAVGAWSVVVCVCVCVCDRTQGAGSRAS